MTGGSCWPQVGLLRSRFGAAQEPILPAWRGFLPPPMLTSVLRPPGPLLRGDRKAGAAQAAVGSPQAPTALPPELFLTPWASPRPWAASGPVPRCLHCMFWGRPRGLRGLLTLVGPPERMDAHGHTPGTCPWGTPTILPFSSLPSALGILSSHLHVSLQLLTVLKP